jgi:hypothetical protein
VRPEELSKLIDVNYLRQYVTSRKALFSFRDATGFLNWSNPSRHAIFLESPSTCSRNLPGGGVSKELPALKLKTSLQSLSQPFRRRLRSLNSPMVLEGPLQI